MLPKHARYQASLRPVYVSAPGRNRTFDLRIKSPPLCLLSYKGIQFFTGRPGFEPGTVSLTGSRSAVELSAITAALSHSSDGYFRRLVPVSPERRAGERGIEPRFTVLETVVMPLHHSPVHGLSPRITRSMSPPSAAEWCEKSLHHADQDNMIEEFCNRNARYSRAAT